MKFFVAFFISAISLFSSTVVAYTVYATDGVNGHNQVFATSKLYTINMDSGQSTLIGEIGHQVNSLAWDSTTKTLYGTTSKNDTHNGLIKINTSTGAATTVSASGGWGGVEGRAVTNITVDSMGNMYGVESNSRHSSGGLNTDQLVKIDSATGSATNVNILGTGSNYALGSSLAFDGSDNLVLKKAFSFTGTFPSPIEQYGIYNIDTLTGGATIRSVIDVNGLSSDAQTALYTKNSSHGTIDKETNLLWILARLQSYPTAEATLFKINHSTGEIVDQLDLVDSPLALRTLAIATVPVPTSIWLFGTGLIGLFRIMRNKKMVI